MDTKLNFTEKSLVLITGASRGIGKSIAISIAKKIQNGTIVVVARDENQLQQVADEIKEIQPNLHVIKSAIDLIKPSNEQLKQLLNINEEFTNAVLIHNVGSVGDVSKRCSQLDSFENWQNYLAFNFSTPAVLTALFIQKFKQAKIYLVNVTSLIGREPFPSFGQYGTGKAARDMYFKILAKEENVCVLNYSPGPCATDMLNEIAGTVQIGAEMFQKLKEENKLIEPDVTVAKMLSILENGYYKSGDTVDFYDEIKA